MSDYVFANAGDPTCLVTWGPTGNAITLHKGEVWFADDPFVLGRPDLFSSTPLLVHSSEGREAPAPTPLDAPRRRGKRA